MLDGDRDGIQEVSDILAGRSDLSAVHIITHGSDGQINLGNSWLNSATLEENSDAVAGWGSALTETGDILFYGCNVAADEIGQALLTNISEITGADVVASEDKTGHESLGGDWDLEYRAGSIETNLAGSSELQNQYHAVLGTETPAAIDDSLTLAEGDTATSDCRTVGPSVSWATTPV